MTVDGETVQTETIIIASGAGHRHLAGKRTQTRQQGVTILRHLATARLPSFEISARSVVGGGRFGLRRGDVTSRALAHIVYLVHSAGSGCAPQKSMADRTVGPRQNQADLGLL